MNIRVLLVLALAFAPGVALAGEHPKEHPTGQEHPKEKGHEHPKGKGHEHPAGHEHPVGSKGWSKQMSKEYTQAVEDHVAQKAPFTVRDEQLNRDWALKLARVHKKKVVHLGGNRFFACADFKSTEKGSKDKVDLDFYATRSEDGEWTVDEILIHKVNGQPRYTYNEKNERVPVK